MNNQTLNEINKRDIDKCYFSISFYHSTIYFNDGNDYNVQPFVKEITKNHLTNIRKTFDFDFILRKHIYSFYFGRDFYKKLSKISHDKPYFFELSTFLEGLLPIIKSMETRMYCPKKEWNQVINSLYKLNKDLSMRCL